MLRRARSGTSRWGWTAFRYGDLYEPERLAELDARFRAELAAGDAALAKKLDGYRAGDTLTPPEESELLIAVARPLARVRGAPLPRREGAPGAARPGGARGRRLPDEDVHRAARHQEVPRDGAAGRRRRRRCARQVRDALRDEVPRARRHGRRRADVRDGARRAARGRGEARRRGATPTRASRRRARRASISSSAGRPCTASRRRGGEAVKGWVSFHVPHAVDHHDLVPLRRPDEKLPELIDGPLEHRRRRDGFALTDARMSPREVENEIDYCIFCHERDKDSCSQGHARQARRAARRTRSASRSPAARSTRRSARCTSCGRAATRSRALAIVVVDNPMCPGTGHRICNDCMKACIFQKQEPVNIPQIETRVLTGRARAAVGLRDLRPAHALEPAQRRAPARAAVQRQERARRRPRARGLHARAPPARTRASASSPSTASRSSRCPRTCWAPTQWPPRADRRAATELYARRSTSGPSLGFGGVSEYGITVRWDKNFLTVALPDARAAPTFRVYGGVRFGGTLDVDDAWALGFDHVAIAAGAGKPTIIDMKNNLIARHPQGVRLPHGAAAHRRRTRRTRSRTCRCACPRSSSAAASPPSTRRPSCSAYYPVQVEKVARRASRRSSRRTAATPRRALQELRRRGVGGRSTSSSSTDGACATSARAPRPAGEEPDFATLLDAWGGVSLVYRKRAQGLARRIASTTRRSRRASRRACATSRTSRPSSASPTRRARCAAVEFERHEPTGEAASGRRSART